jgi:hypothetical protein
LENSKFSGGEALQYAIAATAQAAAGNYIQADKVAKDANRQLKARLISPLPSLKNHG